MTIEELTAMTTEELFKLRGMGRQTALEIITALDAAGIKHNFQVEAPKTEKQILNGLIRDIGVDKAIIVLEKYGKALEKNS